MELRPDGKIFITQKSGSMAVWQNGTELAANFFVNAPLSVNTLSERGLLGVAFDPNFATNRYVYVYYTTDTADFRNRVSRFTADSSGNLALSGSEQIIWEGDAHAAGYHNGGAIHFGPDGKLYIATGDNANGSDSQLLTSQHGKILRVNADGTIPLDNPFYDSTGPNIDAVWSLGLRNPFTFTFQPGTGRLFINDVGQNTWEEINDGGLSQSGRGLNFGWPTTEGDFKQSSFPEFARPFFAYNHNAAVTKPAGNVITGGAFYNPSSNTFGAEYQGDYFFADFGVGWIYRIDPVTKQVTRFATGAGAVDLKVGDDGSLYYLAFGTREVFKVTRSGAGPQITIQPEDQTVEVGKPVTFAVEASGSASFQWQRSDNNGVNYTNINGATAKTLTFTVSLADHNARFRAVASNAKGSATSSAARLTVTSGSAPNAPVVTITGGLTDSKFVAGQAISFSGTATDPEDGTLGANSFSWTISFLTSLDQGDQDNDQLPGLTRPFLTLDDVTSGTFTPVTVGPYTLADVAYAITLVVTDSEGLTSTTRQIISPKTSTITLASVPAGLLLTRDGQPVVAPDSFVSVAGFQRPIGAAAVQTSNGAIYEFVSWSNGGGANHTMSTPLVDTTYTATYAAATLPAGWASSEIGTVGAAGSSGETSGTFLVNGAGFLRGKADSFHFAYLEATGDCSITARVVELPFSAGDQNASAGVMIRSDLTAGSAGMFLGPQAKGPLQLVTRDRPGRATDSAGAGKASLPYWVRIIREGNVLTAYRSSNGSTWTKLRSKNTVALGESVFIGLAVSSGKSGLQSATFDNVTAVP